MKAREDARRPLASRAPARESPLATLGLLLPFVFASAALIAIQSGVEADVFWAGLGLLLAVFYLGMIAFLVVNAWRTRQRARTEADDTAAERSSERGFGLRARAAVICPLCWLALGAGRTSRGAGCGTEYQPRRVHDRIGRLLHAGLSGAPRAARAGVSR